MSNENYRIHERVGFLEQRAHTHEHRLLQLEQTPHRVTGLETVVATLQADHRATRETLDAVGSELSTIRVEVIGGLVAVQTAVKIATVTIPSLIAVGYTVFQWVAQG